MTYFEIIEITTTNEFGKSKIITALSIVIKAIILPAVII